MLSLAFLIAGRSEVSAQEPICSSADVIFCEDFESTSWMSRWQEVSHQSRKVRDVDARNVFGGQASLRLAFPPGDSDGAGWMHYWWNPPPGQGPVYLRWYVKHQAGFNWGGWDVKMAGLDGHRPGVRYGPGAGVRPDGTWFDARFLSLGVPNGPSPARAPLFYISHVNQQSQWGDLYHQSSLPIVAMEADRWYCLEIMVRPNDPSVANGETAMWIDGVLKGRLAGLRWRTLADVEINDLFWSSWIGRPNHTSTQYRWEDNIVVSRSPIGCLAGAGVPPSPPRNVRIVR